MSQLEALLLSIALEAPLALLLIRLTKPDFDRPRLALIAVGVTLLTHPFAWQLNQDLAHVAMVPRMAFIELAVVFIEGLIFSHWGRLGWARGFAISLAANAFSFGVGLLIQA